jgi:enediyne polyketide synthase
MSRPASVAILSMACRLPDASSTTQLWDNLVEGRRSFRAVPRERLDIRRYAAEAIGEAESITPIRAGLLTNWQVDLRSLRIPHKTFLSVDLTHWLALELSAEALDSIGGADRLDRMRTAVIVANTLTGEFSRAGLLRLRLPFLDDVLAEASNSESVPPDLAARLRDSFAAVLRRHFPEPNEESLAGGLANTIAGRIANYFDFRGGAYAIDGACASSLVALADAATLLTTQQADAVVVTAVDLSLDPFELVGFSRNGALAADEMRVFDARASGFWPGEGGASLLLMREDDAMCRALPIMARLRGWGLSSDGAGGLTRPSSDGQLAAYRRAYGMAGVDPADVAFVEAHGTGTAVGDPVEVRALAALREGAKASLPIGSIKANIGHTKAAAGLAGTFKAIAALQKGVIPPHVSCERPHAVFEQIENKIRPILTAEPIDEGKAALAGISSFGFGGINAHVVLEGVVPNRAGKSRTVAISRPPAAQDAELLLISGNSAEALRDNITLLEARAETLSMAELVDAAAYAATTLQPGTIRVAVVAASGVELAERLARAKAAVTADQSLEDVQNGTFVGRPSRPPRLGFVFPGQGASYRPDGGLWRRRFATAASLLERLPAGPSGDPADTAIAQPRILAASLAALDVLHRLGVSAVVAAGHSLGEITALVWAGALADDTALDLAKTRGSLMARFGAPHGAMLRVALPPIDAASIADECGAVIACRNGKTETVLAGPADAIAAAVERCRRNGIEASKLAVSHAFHSPQMADAADALAKALGAVQFRSVGKHIVSTVEGDLLAPRPDLRRLLFEQMTKPVLFDAALAHLAVETDYVVEVGPGLGLTRLARADGMAALSVDAFSDSIKPLLTTAGALFTAGLDINSKALFDDRPVRGFSPGEIPQVILSPCGSREPTSEPRRPNLAAPIAAETSIMDQPSAQNNPLAVTLQAVAQETGLEPEEIDADLRFLDSMHLNSLAVSRIVTAAARMLGLGVPEMPTDFANATARQVADALGELRTLSGDAAEREHRILGVRPWVRTYAMQWCKSEARSSGGIAIRWFDMTTAQQIPAAAADDDRSGLLIWLDGPFAIATAERVVTVVAEAARRRMRHLAFCHEGAPVGGLARSIAREACFRSVRVIDRAAGVTRDTTEFDSRLAAILSADIGGYYEARLRDDGGLEEPMFLPQRVNVSPTAAITSDDVVVVVGGGKGIAAECALHLASRGAALVLLGRSAPDEPAVAATLERARKKGFRCRYVRADVLDARSVHTGLAAVDPICGRPTALIYAAGVNQPKRLTDLDVDTLRRTLALKTTGLETTLAALPDVRRLITFGSIIGRIGLEGEAHYALANAMQSAVTEAWAADAPNRAGLAIEWSVWGGIGMGETLGTVERLSVQGVDAISVDDALAAFDHLMARNAVGTIAVTSRFGPPPDMQLGSVELPMGRFIDEPKVHFPGVELIVETVLTRGRDPYLDDHVVSGQAVMPMVMGLEAMAQIAAALAPLGPRIAVSDVVLSRAVSVPQVGAMRIRIAALHNQGRTIDVHLLTEDDGFASPCMQASFSIPTAGPVDLSNTTPEIAECAADTVYGSLLFNRGRFQRLEAFETITSRRVVARLRPDKATKWFSAYEPSALMLWDPGATDAALHALQVAIPHWRVLPVGAERIEIDSTVGPLTTLRAVERRAAKRCYTFDVVLTDASGRVGQRWIDVTFRAVEEMNIRAILGSTPALAVPYLERAARESLGDDMIEVSLIRDAGQSREGRRGAAIACLGLSGMIDRRGDGRPIVNEGSLSISHCGDMTLAITTREAAVACDMEETVTNEADNGERRRHVVLEVCRKLGRRAPAVTMFAAHSTPARIGDLTVVTFDLPLASGSCVVAFGRLHGGPQRCCPATTR